MSGKGFPENTRMQLSSMFMLGVWSWDVPRSLEYPVRSQWEQFILSSQINRNNGGMFWHSYHLTFLSHYEPCDKDFVSVQSSASCERCNCHILQMRT